LQNFVVSGELLRIGLSPDRQRDRQPGPPPSLWSKPPPSSPGMIISNGGV
jgi:hypothetical protein